MPTYRLTVEYEGTRYRGWQEQKNAKTVAGELRRAIEAAVGGKVELGGSGRTDAGVHALAQVAHLKTAQPIRYDEVARTLEEALPADIHLLAIAPAEERFHARHAATSRAYLYQIARRRTALAKRFVWWVRRSLDLEAMREAARELEGRHDFARFCERPEEQTSTVVVVEKVEIVEAGALVLTRIQASHFLWKMVRRLVGALVEVGTGALQPRELAALLGEGERAKLLSAAGQTPPERPRFEPAASTAPPSGLFLERVIYPGVEGPGPLIAATPIDSAPPPSLYAPLPRSVPAPRPHSEPRRPSGAQPQGVSRPHGGARPQRASRFQGGPKPQSAPAPREVGPAPHARPKPHSRPKPHGGSRPPGKAGPGGGPGPRRPKR